MLHVDYESSGFPTTSPVPNGWSTLTASWDDLLWAAITVGRPNRQFVFRHGTSSQYEALFRLSLVRMTIEQRALHSRRLTRTAAARSLDPSEKGAVNYFMGMTLCKLFASTLLDAPWLLHLDVFRPDLDPKLKGRSRPDLIGQANSSEWLAFESKGRVSAPDSSVKRKAKRQATRCISVQGSPVAYHIGGIAYFKTDTLRFYWCDPEPEDAPPRDPINLELDDSMWRYYYQPAFSLFTSIEQTADVHRRPQGAEAAVPIESADIEISIHPKILNLLREEQWGKAKLWCVENVVELQQMEFKPDGIRIKAGESWSEPFVGATG